MPPMNAAARSVYLDRSGLVVDGQRKALVGAEFHFWRQQAAFWRPTLHAIADAGIEIVSTFVCWDFHEVERDRFDFDGETTRERDLIGFLDLCSQLGLDVILRPGPIIDAEWETRGPAKDVCTLERNDPRFLARARQYLAAVATATAPHQATRGGPIVLIAADNEIFFPYNSDYSWYEEDGDVFVPYKRDFARDAFRGWLLARHGSVEALNSNLGTRYGSEEEVDVPNYAADPPALINESFDFADDYCARYLDEVVGTLRENGIDVPLYTNQKQFLAFLNWEVVGRSLDSVGLNLCMPDLVPGRQALSVSWFIRLQRMRSRHFPWSPEYQAGWIGFDKMFGVITPEHGLYMGLLGAALGLRGMSFFMFVERDDWNWSPVNSFGKRRPRRHEAYSRLVEVLRALEPDEQLSDVGLLWSLREHREHLAATTAGWEDLFKHWMELEEEKEHSRWWRTFVAFHEQDADFRLVDLGDDGTDWPRVIVYVGDGNLGETEISALENALTGGHTLLVAGRLDPGLQERLAGAGEVVACRADEAWQIAKNAGARPFVEASGGAWSFAYAGDGGATTVFVINAGDEPARIKLVGDLVAQERDWVELLSGRAARGSLCDAVIECGDILPAKTAYVFRLDGR